jgi:hypothetical protein
LTWSYMAMTLFMKRPLLKVDFGVVMMVGGILAIVIIFVALSWHEHIVSVALQIVEKAGNSIQTSTTLYERATAWPAYLLVLMGAAMAFAGLIRLSSRQGDRLPTENSMKKV